MDTQNTTISREQFLKIFSHYENNNLLKEIYFNDVYSIAKNDTDSQFYLFIYSEKNKLNPKLAQNQYTFSGYCITKEQSENFTDNTVVIKTLRKELKKAEKIFISFYHLEKLLRNTDTENAQKTKQFIENRKKIFTNSDIVTALNFATNNFLPTFFITFAILSLITLVIGLISADSADPVTSLVLATVILGGTSFILFYLAIKNIKKNNLHKKEIKRSLYHIEKTYCVDITEKTEEGTGDTCDSTIYTAKFANGDEKRYIDLIPVTVGDIFYLVYINNSREIFIEFKASDYTPDINLTIIDKCGAENE